MRLLKLAAVFALLAAPTLLLAGPVDVNTADAETISAELKGIGLKKAQAIVEYRTKHGPFRSADDLTPVSYTHLTLPTMSTTCRSRWSPYH